VALSGQVGQSSVRTGLPEVTKHKRPSLDMAALKSWSLMPLDVQAASALAIFRERPTSELRVLTWNIWFDDLSSQHRLNALLCELLASAPDLACLQEVRPGVAEALRASIPLCSVYDISCNDVGRYGNLTLVRKDFDATFAVMQLPTRMGRNLLLAECRSRLPGLLIGNVHLESLAHEDLRREQLLAAGNALKNHPRALLCGDFNFDSTQTYGDWAREMPQRHPEMLENCVLAEVLPDFVDAWPAVRDDEGFTFDGSLNPVCVRDRSERMRYDRIIAKGGMQSLLPVGASLLGKSEITEWGLMPSDHFGLEVDFAIVQ
jgi:endonuclease/exonuclease/phosphatase family metal-dependent hydrolase